MSIEFDRQSGENFVDSLPERKQKRRDLEKVAELLKLLDLAESVPEKILDHASEAWKLTSPNSSVFRDGSQRNVYRFQTPENGFISQDYESNWDHSCKMILAYINLCQDFAEVMDSFDHEVVCKTILWHDAVEFMHGDIPINQQTEEVKLLKAQHEKEATEKIKNISRLGAEAGKIIEQYEEKNIKETILVKILDISAGQHSFIKAIYNDLPLTSEGIKSATNLTAFQHTQYLFGDQFERVRVVFDKWNEKLMEHFGLNDYEPMSAEAYKQYQHRLGEEQARQLYRTLQRANLVSDDDNPAARMFWALEYSHGRYNSFITDVQFNLDYPDSREKMRKSMERAEHSSVSQYDLFREPRLSADKTT